MSLASPDLFLIFYNDLPFSLSCDIDAYADDSTLTTSVKTVEIINENLTDNCKKVSMWMEENRFKLNASKTHLLTVGTSQRVNGLAHQVEVEMDNIKLIEEEDRCEFLLGIHIQYCLKWNKTLQELEVPCLTNWTGSL